MKKILIIEDDQNTQDLIKLILSNTGQEIITAADGRKGLELAEKEMPDLIILDVMLPELHGYAVCHQIKSNESIKNAKIIILTAKSFSADKRQAQEAGADLFMNKPINALELLEKAKNLLGL